MESNYHKKIYKKKQILLTSAISLRGMNFPYSIDQNGEITNHYDPKYYSDYLKLSIDNNIIPILLINEGWLYSDDKTGKKIMWTGNYYLRGENEVIYREWRNNFHYATYPLKQVNSCIKLCKELCEKFDIPKKCIGHNTKVDGKDEGTMIGWFANAIMAGYDKARNINLDEDWNDQNVGYKELSKEMSLSGKSISYPEAIEGERPIGACVEQPPQFIPIDCLQLGTCFINPKDLTKKERDNLDKFEVLIRFADLGSRGNFCLIPRCCGFKTIEFKNSKLVKGGRLSPHD